MLVVRSLASLTLKNEEQFVTGCVREQFVTGCVSSVVTLLTGEVQKAMKDRISTG